MFFGKPSLKQHRFISSVPKVQESMERLLIFYKSESRIPSKSKGSVILV